MGAGADNNPSLVLKIDADFFSTSTATLLLDNLKITGGNPNISTYTGTLGFPLNVQIPNNSNASLTYTTDFSTVQTTGPSVLRTFRVRNIGGSAPLIINGISTGGNAAADYTPSTISNNPIATSTNPAGPSNFETFTVTFLPLSDGVRNAELIIDSNAGIFKFKLIGIGASCKLSTTDYLTNTLDFNTQDLESTTLSGADLITGTSELNSLGLTLFPSGQNLNTSSPSSWYVRGKGASTVVDKSIEFGGISGVDISGKKNVSIQFNVAAFTTNNSTGFGALNFVTLAVAKNGGSYVDQIKLIGNGKYGFGPSLSTTSYNSSTGAPINLSNSPNVGVVKLSIPASEEVTSLKFKITATTRSDERLWLIDDVKIVIDNAEFKTWDGISWIGGVEPTDKQKAVFEGDYTVPPGGLNICECEVDAGVNFTVPVDNPLTVRGKITNNDFTDDNFIVESDANLIQIEKEAVNAGSITVKRNVNDMNNISTKMDYVYWSSPVSGQQTKGAGGFSPGTPNNRFYTYRESNDRFYETGDPTFVPGKGYAVRAETGINPETGLDFTDPYEKDYKFKGVPNNGEISIDINRSADVGSLQHGFNLVGNPYPSNIDFAKLYTANSLLIYNNIYFWTNNTFTQNHQGSGYTGNNYAIYTGTGGNPATGGTVPNTIIKVGQGFIIQKRNEGGPGSLIFKNSYGAGQDLRVATAGTFYEKNSESKNRFWLKLTAPTGIVNTQLIGYIDGATDDFEQDFDAEAFGLSADLFYSVLNDKKLLIQGKAAQFSIDDQINLGANFFQPGSYTIALDNGEGIFNGSQTIYLKDKQEGIITNLSEGSYTFTATIGDNSGRFEIIYKPESVLATDVTVKEELMVYEDSGDFVVKVQSKKITDLKVFDLNGRLLMNLKPNSTKAVIPDSVLIKGVYVLKISQDGIVTSKKILK